MFQSYPNLTAASAHLSVAHLSESPKLPFGSSQWLRLQWSRPHGMSKRRNWMKAKCLEETLGKNPGILGQQKCKKHMVCIKYEKYDSNCSLSFPELCKNMWKHWESMRKPKLKFPAFAPEAQKSAACGPSSSLARQTFLQQSIMDSSWTLGLIRPVFTECNAGNAGHLESCWELESESETSTVSTLSRGYSLKHHERCSQSLTNTTQPTWVTMSYVSTVHKRNINKWHQQPVKL